MSEREEIAHAAFDREGAARYEQGPRWFVPGYDASHALAAVLLRDRIGESGRLLVVGAGGGVELARFAAGSAGWRFVGVDPSREMLDAAARKVAAAGATARVSLVLGTAADAPRERFDAATAFLCLDFVPDDGSRLAALQAIRARLVPGAPFLMISGCVEFGAEPFEEMLRLYAAFGQLNGAPPEAIAGGLRMQRENLFALTPARTEALLAEAGFGDVRLFYRALWIHGWIARAS